MELKLIEQLQEIKLDEASSIRTLFPDMWGLAKIFTREEIWLYFLKQGKILNKERCDWAKGIESVMKN